MSMSSSNLKAVNVSKPAQLLLALLLSPAKRPPSPTASQKKISALLPEPLSPERWGQIVQELRSAAWIEPKTLRLASEGRAAALELLGLTEVPAKFDWKTIQEKHLFPLASGLSAEQIAAESKAGLATLLLKQKYGLSLNPGATLARVLEAIVCKEVGFPNLSSIDEVRRTVLSRLIGSEEPLPSKVIQQQVPRIALGLTSAKPADIRQQFLQKWAAEPAACGFAAPPCESPAPASPASAEVSSAPQQETPAPGPETNVVRGLLPSPTTPVANQAENLSSTDEATTTPASPLPPQASVALAAAPEHPPTTPHEVPAAAEASGSIDLASFARIAADAAASAPESSHFGPNKVFIHRAWENLGADLDKASLDLRTFKDRLVAANRAGLVKLSRADLVSAMDPIEVRESETTYLDAAFHFIEVEGKKP